MHNEDEIPKGSLDNFMFSKYCEVILPLVAEMGLQLNLEAVKLGVAAFAEDEGALKLEIEYTIGLLDRFMEMYEFMRTAYEQQVAANGEG